MLTGKIIRIHSDGVQNVTLMYRPEVTEEIEVSVHYLRDTAVLSMDEDELEALAKSLKMGVKAIRKHKKKLAKLDRKVYPSLDEVTAYIHKGRK